jgi:hypothetical protein
MTLTAPRPEPSSFSRKLNGDQDKISGFDDGEPRRDYRSDTPAQPYMTGDPEIDGMSEPEIAAALEGADIY